MESCLWQGVKILPLGGVNSASRHFRPGLIPASAIG